MKNFLNGIYTRLSTAEEGKKQSIPTYGNRNYTKAHREK